VFRSGVTGFIHGFIGVKGDVMSAINPLVIEAHKLKASLDLQQNVCTAHNESARAIRIRSVLYRAIQRFQRRLDNLEWHDNEASNA
jgi:hypothetical protein